MKEINEKNINRIIINFSYDYLYYNKKNISINTIYFKIMKIV